jgi:hypothetical protein
MLIRITYELYKNYDDYNEQKRLSAKIQRQKYQNCGSQTISVSDISDSCQTSYTDMSSFDNDSPGTAGMHENMSQRTH